MCCHWSPDITDRNLFKVSIHNVSCIHRRMSNPFQFRDATIYNENVEEVGFFDQSSYYLWEAVIDNCCTKHLLWTYINNVLLTLVVIKFMDLPNRYLRYWYDSFHICFWNAGPSYFTFFFFLLSITILHQSIYIIIKLSVRSYFCLRSIIIMHHLWSDHTCVQ